MRVIQITFSPVLIDVTCVRYIKVQSTTFVLHEPKSKCVVKKERCSQIYFPTLVLVQKSFVLDHQNGYAYSMVRQMLYFFERTSWFTYCQTQIIKHDIFSCDVITHVGLACVNHQYILGDCTTGM